MNSTSRKRSTRPHIDKFSTRKIIHGYCHCGCGQKTRIAEQSSTEWGWVRGEPKRYLSGHWSHPRNRASRIVIIKGKRYRTVPLTQGLEAIVSICDYRRVSNRAWHAHRERGRIYACSRIDNKIVRMHRFILPNVTTDIDHENRNGLHNYRPNLRIATRSQNNANGRKKVLKRGATSRFKWVSWNKEMKKWHAQMRVNGRRIRIGFFDKEREAAVAADAQARKSFGKHARFNFPRKGEQGI